MSIVDIINDRKGGVLAPSEVERRSQIKISKTKSATKTSEDLKPPYKEETK